MISKIIMISSLLFCFACKNQSDKNTSPSSKSSSEQSAPGESAGGDAENQQEENPFGTFAGIWKQAPHGNVEVTGKKSLATIEISLKDDGSFEGTEDMMSTHANVSGTWKVENGKVKLNWNGLDVSLEAADNNTTLTDDANGIHLTK